MARNTPRRIVLGHPYHGVFYWLASAESWRKSPLKSAPMETHPYYKTLYGRSPRAIGLSTDGVSKLTKHIQNQQQWWALAPEISSVLTRQRIEDRCKFLEKQRD